MTRLHFREKGLIRSEEVFSPFWIEWLEFDIGDRPADGAVILDALLRHDSYVSEVLSYGGDGRAAHGPYHLDKLTPSSFAQVEPSVALDELATWLTERSEPQWSLRTRGMSFLERLPADGRVYRLPKLGPTRQHHLGFLLGSEGGYHEWVFIDGESTTLTLVIATDD